jgi:hypothetical protein
MDLLSLTLTSQDEYDVSRVLPGLQYCTSGHDKKATIVGIHDEYALVYKCQECLEIWSVCCVCTSNRARLCSRKAVYNHKSKQHKENYPKRKSRQASTPNLPEPTAKRPNVGSTAAGSDSSITNFNQFPHGDGMDDGSDGVHLYVASHDDHGMEQQQETVSLLQGLPAPDHHHDNSQRQIQSKVFFSTEPIPYQEIADDANLGFTSERNQQFFHFCQTRRFTDTSLWEAGIEYLTTRCLSRKVLKPMEMRKVDNIPREFRNMLMEYSNLCFRSGAKDRDLLCKVVKNVHAAGVQDGWQSCLEYINDQYNRRHLSTPEGNDHIKNIMTDTQDAIKVRKIGSHIYSYQLPMKPEDVRAMFIENKFSIVQNLPYPPVMDDIPDHAYVSLVDCIRDAIGFASCRVQVIDPFPTNTLEDNTKDISIGHPSRSRRAYEIFTSKKLPTEQHSSDNKVLSCYLYFWSDDADTNSTSMKGRAQVWVKSMTIGSPGEYGNWLQNTYPVAIGAKKASHDAVEAKHAADLQRLQDPNLGPFYVGDVNKFVRCRFGTMANLGDQPEKRDNNWVGRGNAVWHGRSFVSANHKELYPKLKACGDCFQTMNMRYKEGPITQPLPECDKCLNWDVLKESPLALCTVPGNYVVDSLEPHAKTRVVNVSGKNYIKPFRLTYPGLCDAITVIHKGFAEWNWNVESCKEYYRVECLSEEAYNKIREYAERTKAYLDATNDDPNTRGRQVSAMVKESILRLREECPELFQRIHNPALYSRPGVELSTHVEGIMHLIFLGIVKTMVKDIQVSLLLKKGNAEFLRQNGDLLQSLQKLNLDWLKLLPYSGGNFYGWNATQYVGFSRLLPWFYQKYGEVSVEPLPERDLPPEADLHICWLKPDLEYWLRIRGLKVSGSKGELLERVSEYMAKDDPPQVLPSVTVDAANVRDLVNSLYNMLECFMGLSVSESTVLNAEYTIRIFLSCVDIFDANVHRHSTSWEWRILSSHNFLCLLNLPDIMRSHGPLRHLWEGKFQGEGLLPYIKNLHTQGIRKNWAQNLLKNLLRERSFDNLLQHPVSTPKDGVFLYTESLAVFKTKFYQYASINDVEEILNCITRAKKKPLSVVVVRETSKSSAAKVYAVVGREHDEVLELSLSTDVFQETFGQHYYRFHAIRSDMTMNWTDVKGTFPVSSSLHLGFALLLPILEDDPSCSNLFAVVSCNWSRLGPNNTLNDLVD